MATDQQLESALYKADKAGNVEDAKLLQMKYAEEEKQKKVLKSIT